MHHQTGMKAVSSTSVPWILSALFGGGVFSRTRLAVLNPSLGYQRTAGRSDGRLTSLCNIYHTNLRPRLCIFGSWGGCTGSLIRVRVQCPANHPSIASQESVRISAWLFPVHHVPFQCSYQDLGGFGIKERRMLKDQQFESQKIWKGKSMVGRLFVPNSRRCSWPDVVSLKNHEKHFEDWEGYAQKNNSMLSLCSWLDPAKNTFPWEFLGSQLLLYSLAFRPVDLCHWNICCLYVYILKGDMNFSGHFKSFIECFCVIEK